MMRLASISINERDVRWIHAWQWLPPVASHCWFFVL